MPRIEEIECGFGVKGIDEDAIAGMAEADRWILAGSYYKPRSKVAVTGRAVIEGIIQAWEPDDSSASEFQGCTYSFAEVTHYEFVLDGKELWYWDFWERGDNPRIMGVPIFRRAPVERSATSPSRG